jgi:type I restriction enzyme R subunit
MPGKSTLHLKRSLLDAVIHEVESPARSLPMPTPGEHKTVQARIRAYAEAIGWTIVSREEAEERRGLKERGLSSTRQIGERGGQECPPSVEAPLSLFFDDLPDAKVREFNLLYAEAEGALLGQFRHLHTEIYGNRAFPDLSSNRPRQRLTTPASSLR